MDRNEWEKKKCSNANQLAAKQNMEQQGKKKKLSICTVQPFTATCIEFNLP